MTDKIKQLIKDAQNGDSHSFHQLVALHDEKIMVLAYQLMKNKQDAEDLYQDAFVKAYNNIRSFRFESSFYTWLYRITVNTALNMKRKMSRMRTQEPIENYDPIENIPEPVSTNKRGEINRAIKAATNELPEKQRTAFILKYLQDLKIKDVSAIMGISEGTVKKYLFRAMEKMRIQLKEYRYV
ncbi:MAG: RNA polymerase sigma factor [Candidatus Marinimicrobia bacterium]|nr:RNA polymerase sigma factor [Candidatus Neomarinimicrobiota bacterium]MCH7762405.1 RNA polymerase sigma factor [Candidatus Neomarinimicrobiota bacterium]